MRVCNILILLVFFVLVNLFCDSLARSAELIEPTQTLGGKAKQTTGRLTVLSEPPGQKITLDGDSLGKTPTFMVEVEAGVHTLGVKDSKTDIYVEAGKTVKISLHKNKFILIPVKEKQIEEPTVTEATTGTRTSSASQTRDPIRDKNDRDRRRTQQRWQQFLDGTKPTP